MADYSKILKFISESTDADRLRAIVRNARNSKDRDAERIYDAAFKRLVSLVPSETPGTVEHDFWCTINAFEFALTEQRGKTTRLNRTRQKVDRVGVLQTLNDWAFAGRDTDGFKMLLEMHMPELTGEAIVLRHRSHFAPEVIEAARQRLIDAGVDVATLPSG